MKSGDDFTILALAYSEANDFDRYGYDPLSDSIITSATAPYSTENGLKYIWAISSLNPGRYYIEIYSSRGSGNFAFIHFNRNRQTQTTTPAATTVAPAPAPTNTHPSTGTSLFSTTMSGSKYLTIYNQNNYDAVITMRMATTPPVSGDKVLSFYLRAHDQYTVRKIGAGEYTLWYKLGEGWDSVRKTFLVDHGARRFDDIFGYTSRTAGYEAWIYPVADGNASTTDVPADQV